ncbi:MAG TPA: ATP-binding protein, partial [Actinoplanes sp.]
MARYPPETTATRDHQSDPAEHVPWGEAYVHDPTGATVPLIGRDDDLEILAGSLRKACSGIPAVVLIEAASGVGKSRLLGETVDLASADGVRVMFARCTESEQSTPFGVVRQLFAYTRAVPSAGDVGSAVQTIWAADPRHRAAEPLLPVFDGLRRLVADASATGCLLIAVDDIHFMDLLSLRWLAYLIRRLDNLHVAVVASVATGRSGSAPMLLADMMVDPAAMTLRPGLLTEQGTADLVRSRYGPSVDGGFVRRCHRVTGGNPLLLRHLLTDLIGADAAPRPETLDRLDIALPGFDDAVWQVTRRQAIDTRILQGLAILDDRVRPADLADLWDMDIFVALRMGELLTATGLGLAHRRVYLRHPLIRRAVLGRMPVVMRSDLHRRAARQVYDSGGSPTAIGGHLLSCLPADDEWVAARLHELSAQVPSAEATAYLSRALDEPPAPADLAAVLASLGRLQLDADPATSVGTLGVARALHRDERERLRLSSLQAGALARCGRHDEALALLGRAVAVAERGEAIHPGVAAGLVRQRRVVAAVGGRGAEYGLLEELDALRDVASGEWRIDDALCGVLAVLAAGRLESPSFVAELARRGLQATVPGGPVPPAVAAGPLAWAGREDESTSYL